VFGNRVLRKMFGPKGTAENSIMRSFMICTQHQIVYKSRITRWVRRVAHMGARKGVNRVFVEKPYGRSQL